MDLKSFIDYVLGQNFYAWRAIDFYDYGSVLSMVIYRDAAFQAELFVLKAGPGFPRMHRHPDVESVEYPLSADIPFIVNGDDLSRCGGMGRGGMADRALDGGMSRVTHLGSGVLYYVAESDWHGVGDVPGSASFLSIQQWKNGAIPTSVGLNWEGTPVSTQHMAMLRKPGAKWIKSREPRGVRHENVGAIHESPDVANLRERFEHGAPRMRMRWRAQER